MLFFVFQADGNKEYTLGMLFIRLSYTKVIKPILFRFDPEFVHENMTNLGEILGANGVCKRILEHLFAKHYPELTQQIAGITFSRPIGLAAGFDYDARLTQLLPALGFGFETIGTVTYSPYAGNPKPMLGRLPLSRSLMVNKGFKSKGAKIISQKLANLHFAFPVGISIGRTNNAHLTQSESVVDIVNALRIFEQSNVANRYYEINISCPNLYGDITFYTKKNLTELLNAIKKVNIKKPVFIKMPIDKDDAVVLSLLETIAQFTYVKGVIFGNLQKNRQDPSLVQEEVKKWKVGNFSGKPTWERSNALIALCYRNYKNRFIIIGCGGVFSAEDAYKKIKLGASLVQLITGLIYEGPQLVSEINAGMPYLLKRDGFSHINDAIGVESSSL